MNNKKSKGQWSLPEEIGTTTIVLFIAILVLVMVFIYSIVVRFPVIGKGALSGSLEFVDASNKPYLVGEILTHYKIDDRQLLEHSIESAFAGSLENASSKNIKDGVTYFMDHYKSGGQGFFDSKNSKDFRYYSVAIRNIENNEIFQTNNMYKKCTGTVGANDYTGTCVSVPALASYRCGFGQDEITDDNRICGLNIVPDKFGFEVCCLDYELKDGVYQSRINPTKFVPVCGPADKKNGVCDYPKTITYWYPGFMFPIPKTLKFCREGRLRLDEENKECEKDGLVCCAPLNQLAEETTIESQTTIPLLYKGIGNGNPGIGWLEVVAGV